MTIVFPDKHQPHPIFDFRGLRAVCTQMRRFKYHMPIQDIHPTRTRIHTGTQPTPLPQTKLHRLRVQYTSRRLEKLTQKGWVSSVRRLGSRKRGMGMNWVRGGDLRMNRTLFEEVDID
jgi:hypothetical protein